MTDAHDSTDKAAEVRLDYAWKYFESAARQRTLFLNFFFLIVGILASGYGLALDKRLYLLAVGLAIYGAVTTVAFIAFDHRLLVFVRRALDVLAHEERERVFPDGYGPRGANGKVEQLGLARTESDAGYYGGRTARSGAWYTKVLFWQRVAIQGLAGIGFVLGIGYALSIRHDTVSSVSHQASLLERIEHLEKAVDILNDNAARMPVEEILSPPNDVDRSPES